MKRFCYLLLTALLIAACQKDLPPYPGEQPTEHEQPEQPVLPEKMPRLTITTANGAAIDSKKDFVHASFLLEDAAGERMVEGRIRGRGNATWNYEKKPYKIKFDDKQSVCGFPANRDWALLAEYCDKSLLRDAYMFTLGQFVGIPYNVRFKHVHVTINGTYQGIYLLTETVERAKYRIDIDDDGFIIEDDHYWYNEPLFFTSNRSIMYTFKYPDADEEGFDRQSDSYIYIYKFINELEGALYGADFTDPQHGYRAYLDEDSFARWYLVNELLCNYDPNHYYVLHHRGARLEMTPLWDGEWCLGLAGRNEHGLGWASPPMVSPDDIVLWSREKYFTRLFEDPYFVSVVKAEWEELKPKLPDFKAAIQSLADSIAEDQEQNFERWPLLDQYVSVGLIALGSWDAEVAYAADFFDRRCQWFDNFIKSIK